jgi:hypothetical protein
LRTHVVIPDTQAKPGVPTDHLRWTGQYIVDKFAGQDIVVVHLGDHWDMFSLSSYDKGKKAHEGARVDLDIEAGNDAFAILNEPLERRQAWEADQCRQKKDKIAFWQPRKVLLRGNHEYRIERAAENDAILDGLLSMSLLDSQDWEVHGFLDVVKIDGIAYSHYFYNPMTGRPYGGQNIETRLKTVGASFTMGHQQGLGYGMRYVMGRSQHGLVAGSCYLHDERYLGPQGNTHWRGIVVCHEVQDGSYDPMFVSLDYLCRRYEGVTLDRFRGVAA